MTKKIIISISVPEDVFNQMETAREFLGITNRSKFFVTLFENWRKNLFTHGIAENDLQDL